MYRTLGFVAMLFIASLSAAFAEEFGNSVAAVLKQAAVERAGRAVENRLNRREEVKPIRAGQNLGRIVISRGSGGGWYDDNLLIKWTENALHDVGFEALSRQGRDLVRREMEENRAPNCQVSI